ncbi:AMP-binding protein [Pseudactinotalea sp. HY160]|uniref:class I adenylate-forming enzyme family protein n=1 Tax=Pseudactinotalea sp. HY160 TaxID=2654490 RepID=UPI00128DFFBC|nr:AMP-binding protein [Pseudactinotalea sp. HY160]MPV48517.1 AMP-binding protein [Pseudactinotalea sp. HY160]
MVEDPANVGDYLLGTGRGDDVALIDRTGAHTYADLRRATAALAGHIAGWGLPAGSRIALLSRNSLFWAAAYLAILRSGHVVVPLATALTARDAVRNARFVDCAAVVVDSALAGRFAPLLRVADHVADERAMTGPVPGAGGPVRQAGTTAPDSDAVLVFTSGTTASPRAVRVSHRNIRANTDSIIRYLELTRADRVLVVLPFSYCYGASLLHTHLRAGGGLSICDTFAYPETVIEAIERDGCTGLAGVPSTYQLLLRASSFESTRLPTLRTLQQAGGRLAQPQVDRVAAAQPQARLFVMYGQTEATARLSYLPPELWEERRGSIGRGIPGVSLTVVDPDGREVAPGVVGEIVAHGENITNGYWNDPEGTAARFVDGGLRTGDLAHVDEDGFVYIDDRQADFIKSWGFRVSTHEIEDSVLTLPGVTGAAVVGRPDDEAGEAVVLFYVTAPAGEVTPAQVLAHCRTALARHLVPREARRVPGLPLNQNGKVVKATLKEWAARADGPGGE